MEFDEETGQYVAKMSFGGIAKLFPFIGDILKNLSETDPKAAKKLKESIDEIEVKENLKIQNNNLLILEMIHRSHLKHLHHLLKKLIRMI